MHIYIFFLFYFEQIKNNKENICVRISKNGVNYYFFLIH